MLVIDYFDLVAFAVDSVQKPELAFDLVIS